MNDPQVTTEELKRRKAEKDKRYKACMKVLKPMGFVQDGNSAVLKGFECHGMIDMDDPDIYDGTPAEIINRMIGDAYIRGKNAARREIRETMGIFQ